MCDICDGMGPEFAAKVAAVAPDPNRVTEPVQFAREDYQSGKGKNYLRASYVGDYIVVTEINPEYTDSITGLAILFGDHELVPAPFKTAVAEVGDLSIGEFKKQNGFPELVLNEDSRKLTEDEWEIPKKDELDAWHESVKARVESGEF